MRWTGRLQRNLQAVPTLRMTAICACITPSLNTATWIKKLSTTMEHHTLFTLATILHRQCLLTLKLPLWPPTRLASRQNHASSHLLLRTTVMQSIRPGCILLAQVHPTIHVLLTIAATTLLRLGRTVSRQHHITSSCQNIIDTGTNLVNDLDSTFLSACYDIDDIVTPFMIPKLHRHSTLRFNFLFFFTYKLHHTLDAPIPTHSSTSRPTHIYSWWATDTHTIATPRMPAWLEHTRTSVAS